MKIIAPLLVLANAALLVPAAEPYTRQIAAAALLLAIVLLVMLLTAKSAKAAEMPAAPAVEPVKPAPVPAAAVAAPTHEALTLLGVLQEKGRLVDFLMEDIAPYSDADVGGVARSVHQGCRAALREHFQIEPVNAEGEGASVTVPAGYPADEIRLSGNLSGEAPFAGKVVHKGWRATSVKLPRALPSAGGKLPVIAPVQIEVS